MPAVASLLLTPNRLRGLLRGNSKRRTLEERRQIRSAVAAWKYSEPEQREPSTLQGLADLLGVSRSTVIDCKRKLPNTLEEYLELNRVNTLPNTMKLIEELILKGPEGKGLGREGGETASRASSASFPKELPALAVGLRCPTPLSASRKWRPTPGALAEIALLFRWPRPSDHRRSNMQRSCRSQPPGRKP